MLFAVSAIDCTKGWLFDMNVDLSVMMGKELDRIRTEIKKNEIWKGIANQVEILNHRFDGDLEKIRINILQRKQGLLTSNPKNDFDKWEYKVKIDAYECYAEEILLLMQKD